MRWQSEAATPLWTFRLERSSYPKRRRHFYHVIFDPDGYPVNFAFIDGRMSEELYREEHELAFEQMNAQCQAEASGPQPEETEASVS